MNPCWHTLPFVDAKNPALVHGVGGQMCGSVCLPGGREGGGTTSGPPTDPATFGCQARPPAGRRLRLASESICPGGTVVLLFRFLGCFGFGLFAFRGRTPAPCFSGFMDSEGNVQTTFQGSCGRLSGSAACNEATARPIQLCMHDRSVEATFILPEFPGMHGPIDGMTHAYNRPH